MLKYSVPYYTTHPYDTGWNPAPEHMPDKNTIWYRQLDAFREFKRFNGEDTDTLEMSAENERKRIKQGNVLADLLLSLGVTKLLSLGSGKRIHEKTIAEKSNDITVIASDIYYREEEKERDNLFRYPLDISDTNALKNALEKWQPDALLSYTSVSVITDNELESLALLSEESGIKFIILYTAEEMRILNLIKYAVKILLWEVTGQSYVNGGYFRSFGQIKSIFEKAGFTIHLDKIISRSPGWLARLKGCQRLMIFALDSSSSNTLSKQTLEKIDFSVFEHGQ